MISAIRFNEDWLLLCLLKKVKSVNLQQGTLHVGPKETHPQFKVVLTLIV